LGRSLPLLLLSIALSSPFLSIGIALGSGSKVELSPGKVLPQGYNHYLETRETQVKVEFSRAIVLQGTVGDLLFNVTVDAKKRNIAIYIPPEFGVRGLAYVWTSVTNDYRFISLSTLSDRDPIAPGSRRILVSNGTGGIGQGSHFIRIFNVTAPSVVGRYFFKVYTDGASIGAEKFPTLVVSADPNPAYISGTVLDGRRDPSYHGRPISLTEGQGGRVVAEGVTPDGRIVVAQAFFNASASGRYTLYGLAPGTYRLTASVAGYYNTTRPEPVAVLPSQSLDGIDLYVLPSPRMEGTVWSKCGGFLQEWGSIGARPGPKGAPPWPTWARARSRATTSSTPSAGATARTSSGMMRSRTNGSRSARRPVRSVPGARSPSTASNTSTPSKEGARGRSGATT